MVNDAHLFLTGYVATEPRWVTTKNGHQKVTMRVAWTPRYFDRSTGEWADGQTSFVSVNCWRRLAENVSISLRRGDPVVVRGRITVVPADATDGPRRDWVTVEASAIGHDLSHGVSAFKRAHRSAGETAADRRAAGGPDGAPDGVLGGDDLAGITAALGGGSGGRADGGHGLANGGVGLAGGEDIFDGRAVAELAAGLGADHEAEAPF